MLRIQNIRVILYPIEVLFARSKENACVARLFCRTTLLSHDSSVARSGAHRAHISERKHLPLLPLPLLALCVSVRSCHDTGHIPLHALLVKAIELQPIRGGWARGAGAGDLLHGVEGVNKDAI